MVKMRRKRWGMTEIMVSIRILTPFLRIIMSRNWELMIPNVFPMNVILGIVILGIQYIPTHPIIQ